MSVYKPKKSPFYCFDFQRNGLRFYGTTKCRNRREAQAVEREKIKLAEHNTLPSLQLRFMRRIREARP